MRRVIFACAGGCAGWLLMNSVCWAEPLATTPPQSGIARPTSSGLAVIDWLIIALYAVSTLAMAWYYSRKQETLQEYFIGSGNMNSVMIGISLFVTLLSTISYLSTPGEILGKGPGFLSRLLAIPLIYLVVGYVILPIYMRQRVTSAYELLEERLGIEFRLLGAIMFLLLRLVWMSLLTYLTAKAMTVMMGIDAVWIPAIVLGTGLVTVLYTSMGGMRAVVITDLYQTVLLFGGAVLVLVVITIDYGGLGWFPTTWQTNWDTQPLISFDPQVRISVFAVVLSVFVWEVCTAGGDQVSVQRFMSTRDAKAARRAFLTQMGVNVCVSITLSLVGLALLGYFLAHPEELPAGMTLQENADDIFPRFIAYHLPIGVSGLVVSAMFAAAMSSIDSGVNSITAVVMTDFLGRFGRMPKTEKGHVWTARILAFTIGISVMIGSSFIGNIDGNITAVAGKTANLITTPLFALFVYALFIRFSHPIGVWLGTLVGLTTAILIAFSGPVVLYLNQAYQIDPALFGTEILAKTHPVTQQQTLTAIDPVSFLWIGPVALTLNLLTGITVSWILNRKLGRAKSGEISAHV